jgi:hypothetical protein
MGRIDWINSRTGVKLAMYYDAPDGYHELNKGYSSEDIRREFLRATNNGSKKKRG